MLQAVVLLVGTSAIAIATFAQFDFSWAQATQALPDGQLSIIQPIGNDVLPWPGLIIGVPILSFFYWILNQYIVQRVLGAKSVQDARWGAMLAGFLKLSPLFIMMLPGAFAVTLLPNLSSPDQVFPTLVQEFLPIGLTGIVLAGIISAILSSVDSALNSASTLFTLDFVEPMMGRDLEPKESRRIGTFSTLGFMVIAAIWAPSIQGFPGLFSYIQSMFAYIVSPIVAVFIVGFFWDRMNAQSAFTTFIAGHTVAAITFALTQTGVVEIHFLYVAGLLFAVSCLITVVTSLNMGAAPDKERISELTFSSGYAEPEGSVTWYADFRVQAAVIVVLTLALVITFW